MASLPLPVFTVSYEKTSKSFTASTSVLSTLSMIEFPSFNTTSPIDDALAELPEDFDCYLFAPEKHPTVPTIVIDKDTCRRIDTSKDNLTFHEFEVEVLWQFYMLFHECGADLMTI